MPPSPLTRLRKVCSALPGTREVKAWNGAPTFRANDTVFAMYADAKSRHGNSRPSVWLKAAPGNQEFMVRDAGDRFFVPPYVGPFQWIGVWLDRVADWKEVAQLAGDAHRLAASKKVRTKKLRVRPGE